ncbi:zinc finger protein 768-like [Pollicipes pollicipes]|uniref:zinc finger protein 768-like n=1 Tax=Pollicipes pollicipes TaxID=41117 RepID=UPI0018855752|nr:zinc finger protein 768-like [Pollicipes pollicipes]
MFAAGTSEGSAGTAPDFRCGRCAAAFRSYESLLHHHKTHEGLTRCPLCDTCLNRVSDLRRHMGRVHKLERPQVAAMLGRRGDWQAAAPPI